MMDPNLEAASRCSKPGTKRLALVLSILLSFILGLPFWIKSTKIYRTPLPFTIIEERTAHGIPSSFLFSCYFHFVFGERGNEPSIGQEELEQAVTRIRAAMQHLVSETNSSYGGCGSSFVVMASLDTENGCLRVGVPENFPVWPCGLMRSELPNVLERNNFDTVDEFLHNYSSSIFVEQHEGDYLGRRDASGIYTILNIKGSNFYEQSRFGIGKYRHAWIAHASQEDFLTTQEISSLSHVAVRFFMNGGSHKQQKGMSMEENGDALPVAADGQAILSFSLLNAKPEDWIFDWDFNNLSLKFLEPALKALQQVAVLTVESQVLYYTPTNARSSWDPEIKKHVVFSEDLPFFVNANEWHLDTSSGTAGRSKVLHFSIYIPAADECPLTLKHQDGTLSKTNGFTSPGWGGVAIFNPGKCERNWNGGSVHRLSAEDLKPVMRVIISQLRVLFGLPPFTPSAVEENFVLIPAVNTGFSDWELDILLRRRATADLVSSAHTLGSLSHLVQSLPNMVILDTIGDQVKSSLAAAASAEHNASIGLYRAAAESARQARSWAEEAFFQPSIMSLLYLPLEHHFAIYTPFFVPVMLHTVLAAVREVKRFRSEWKKYHLQDVQSIRASE